MAIPTPKSAVVENHIDKFTIRKFGAKRRECIEKDNCLTCNGPATNFTDELSKKEYTISGMCQKCQDEIFLPKLSCKENGRNNE